MGSDCSRIIGVGGLGGSGTRVAAVLLKEMGFHPGHFLNKEFDNLIFTRLFKNPDWYATASEESFRERFGLFYKILRGEKLDQTAMKAFMDAVTENKLHSATILQRFHFMVRNQFAKPMHKNLAWKEPNTQIMLQRIIPLTEGLRYIHVVRHGLDMAFSNNRQQLINWGWLYGIEQPHNDSDDVPVKQLEFWLRSTEDVINNCKPLLDDRFYLLNYNHLLENPVEEIAHLARFLGVETDHKRLRRLVQHVKRPASEGRFRHHDLSVFSQDQLQRVRTLSFHF